MLFSGLKVPQRWPPHFGQRNLFILPPLLRSTSNQIHHGIEKLVFMFVLFFCPIAQGPILGHLNNGSFLLSDRRVSLFGTESTSTIVRSTFGANIQKWFVVTGSKARLFHLTIVVKVDSSTRLLANESRIARLFLALFLDHSH